MLTRICKAYNEPLAVAVGSIIPLVGAQALAPRIIKAMTETVKDQAQAQITDRRPLQAFKWVLITGCTRYASR